MGILIHATVADALSRRRSRTHRTEHLRQIENMLTDQRGRPSSADDIPLWRYSGDTYKAYFNSKKTWLQLRQAGPQKPWHNGVWFRHSTSKFSFITWLAVHNRMSTGDRMLSWNANVNPSCVLCQHSLETRFHLFFRCSFSATIWKALTQGLLQRRYSTNWHTIISFISKRNHPCIVIFLVRYVFQATIHSIWKERNSRIHGEQPLTSNTLITLIDKQVRNRLSSIRLLGDTAYENALHKWFEART